MEDNRGVREIAAYFLPIHAAGIIYYAPFYQSIPSAVLPHVQYQRGTRYMQKCLDFPICRCNQSAMGASRGDIRQGEQPWGRTTFPARPRSLIWFQQTGRNDGHASQCLWFFKYIPLLSHCFIDRRQTSLCSLAKRALRECSICNVITQMRMAERWTDTNPPHPTKSPASSMVILVDRPCQVSHRLRRRGLLSLSLTFFSSLKWGGVRL